MHWEEETQVRDAEDNLDIELTEYLINIYQLSSMGERGRNRGGMTLRNNQGRCCTLRRKGLLRMNLLS